MNKFFKYFLILLSLILVVVPIIFAIIILKSSEKAFENSYNQDDSDRTSNVRKSKIDPSKDPFTILFLGIDENSGREENGQTTEHSRSDAMILSTFNADKNRIRLLSIPRDTVSYIPKVGYYDKITHAHVFGGPTSSMDAVEATLNVPVDYYIRINMDAFVDAVDELGGIKYDVPYNLDEPNTNDDGNIKVKKGYQTLNGDQALAVARTRHHDSDLKRGERQMELIKILFAKAQQTNSFDKLDNVISIVGKNSKHNFSQKEMEGFVSTYMRHDMDIKSKQLKGKDDYLKGIYYYNPSIKSIQNTSNLLRNDLNLPKISDKDAFLNQRVTDFYGTLVPQTKIDSSLLKKNQNDTSDDENNNNENDNESNQNTNNTQTNDNQSMDSQTQQSTGNSNYQEGQTQQQNAVY
ncbi:LCP family protein [Staphylococcus sp. Marseille-Q6910]|uniref:LCP family protein n=1 Tax=Staphylococcus sp. Marseille-Q6910 TaxID=2937990 RepID=UPI0020408B15|nr:LCP family protein [Staphylococcus sp. Marseille-Q6910]